MSYKRKTIAGIEELIERYSAKELDFDSIFAASLCPFCKLYDEDIVDGCGGCFMQDGDKDCGSMYATADFRDDNGYKAAMVKERVKWHIANLPYIQKIPAKYFTPSGWRNFDNFMPDGWRNRILGNDEEMKI